MMDTGMEQADTELPRMKQADEIVDTYEQAMADFRATLEDTRRHWCAYMLTQYPHRDVLDRAAYDACRAVGSAAAEVNAIYEGEQVTVANTQASAPVRIPVESSLCVLAVGAGRPLAVDDLQANPLTMHHTARQLWSSWASVPLTISGVAVGTICALEHQPRDWTLREQAAIEHIAGELGTKVELWIDAQR